MVDSGTPEALYGDVFLGGPDDIRTRVSCGRSLAAEFCRVLEDGVSANDRKDQGAAVLTIIYSGGRKERVAITQSALVRRDGKTVQVNKQQMVSLLERIAEECTTRPS